MVELRKLWVDARHAGVVPSEMMLVEFRRIFDIFKIYANATRRYNPQAYNGRVTLFLPADDFSTIFKEDRDSAKRKSKQVRVDPVEGWGRLAKEVDVYRIPGDHFSILYEPNVQLLGEELRKSIAETRARLHTANQ